MRVELEQVTPLRFSDGSPVRAASAIATLGAGWLVAQDDATHACWWVDGVGRPVRLFPAIAGLETFSEAEGTKHLKPDVEAAVEIAADGGPAVLLLGSGSTPARMRGVLVSLSEGTPSAATVDLTPLYAAVTEALGIPADQVNLEGACVLGATLRWFNRGLPTAGLPSASVDLDLAAVLAAARGADASETQVGGVRQLDLGSVAGVGLAVTDAATLPDGRVLVSAAAEDSPTTFDDGPVVASALAVLDGDSARWVEPLPELEGHVAKVEGQALLDWDDSGGLVVAVVDADDPTVPSSLLSLRVAL